MRIGIVMSSFSPGGTERQMIELVRRLDRDRWAVHVAAMRDSGAWRGRVADVAPITWFPVTSFKRASTLGHMSAFARWCREARLDIVHTTDFPTNLFALPAAALARVPVRIANRRDINPGRSALDQALQRVAYSFAHAIVANARAVADHLAREAVPRRKIEVVANGLELPSVAPRPAGVPRRRVAVVANLRPEKGHDVIIDAAPAVLQAFPDARFDIVGGGGLRDALVERARRRGVAHAFTFHGHCDDVPARLAAADLFVLASRSEAFPNAVLEAMAAALPVVATEVGGIVEVVRAGQNGLLIAPGDAGALADRLKLLMSDPALADRVSREARATAESYSFDRMVGGFEAIYLSRFGIHRRDAGRRLEHTSGRGHIPART